MARQLKFQSTHPVWGETAFARMQLSAHTNFNPLTPCGVRPFRPLLVVVDVADFNPLTPCGVRPCTLPALPALSPFQSTHPVWGETSATADIYVINRISIHPSRVGWDQITRRQSSPLADFNPPIPCGMGLDATGVTLARVDISIHPSRVGWDGLFCATRCKLRDFNPPIPCGMGPSSQVSLLTMIGISIHPSRVGWDGWPGSA